MNRRTDGPDGRIEAQAALHEALRRMPAWNRDALGAVLDAHRDTADAGAMSSTALDAPPSGARLFCSRWHVGHDPVSFADLVTAPADGTAGEVAARIAADGDRTIARVLMGVDWRLVGAEPRLRALATLRGERKSGLAWLTGFDGGLPAWRRLSGFGDRIGWIALRTITALHDRRDARSLRRVDAACRTGEAAALLDPLADLAVSAAARGAKIGYAVPRLILLREIAHATRSMSALVFACDRLAEVVHQYLESAHTTAGIATCHRARLGFLLEAEGASPNDDNRRGHLVDTVLSAVRCGIDTGALLPDVGTFPAFPARPHAESPR